MDIAQCSPHNPERDCQRVLVNKYQLALPVQKTQLGENDKIPILKIRHWFEFFHRHSCLHILHGLQNRDTAREQAILSSFWANFEKVYPGHQFFQEVSQGRIAAERAIPLVLHGDEGRGRRHSAHFVLSFHSLLGKGFGKMKGKDPWARMECNFDGHTYTNRFLIASLQKKDYSDLQWETWGALMDHVAQDAGSLWKEGVVNQYGVKYWGVVLGLCADWPFLHKSANFSRSFNNIQKRVVVKNPPAGICHLCRAGQPDIAFEQLETRRPDWLGTEFTQDPYVERPPFVDHLLYEPGKDAALWNFDWFHTMHLGVLRNFLGSVLALLSQEEDHGAIDDRFAALTEDYKTWCHQNSRRAYVSKLSKEAIGWDTTNQFPSGTWHKGGLTTVLMEYLEARFARQSFPHEPLLSLAAEACDAIQRLGRLLYRSSLWLEPERCKYCAELGLKFLRRYSQMATLAKSQGRHLFSLQPKIHVLHHFVLQLWDAHVRGVKMLNILATSCQPSEDFIGRPSRLSRRVTSQSPVLHRIMQRYLQSVYHHFIQAGFLVRSRGWRS